MILDITKDARGLYDKKQATWDNAHCDKWAKEHPGVVQEASQLSHLVIECIREGRDPAGMLFGALMAMAEQLEVQAELNRRAAS